MQLSKFKKLLAEHAHCHLRFVLPTGSKISPHAHVTEVARMDKKFVDCGGTFHTQSYCRLQTWLADDTDHRLTAGKLLAVLDLAESFLATDDLEVDVELEAPFVSQFPILEIVVEDGQLFVHLDIRHTDCLAPTKCLPPNLNKSFPIAPLPNFKTDKCC